MVVLLAGNIAARRAQRGTEQGWSRCLSHKEKTGFHEAAHVALGLLFSFEVRMASICEDPLIQVGKTDHAAGFVVMNSQPTSMLEARERLRAQGAEHDSTQVARLALLLAPRPTWRSMLTYIRAAKVEAMQRVEENWMSIKNLADALFVYGDLDEQEINRIFEIGRPPGKVQATNAPGSQRSRAGSATGDPCLLLSLAAPAAGGR